LNGMSAREPLHSARGACLPTMRTITNPRLAHRERKRETEQGTSGGRERQSRAPVEASFIIRSRMGNDTWPRSANSHRSKGHVNMPPTFPVVFVCVCQYAAHVPCGPIANPTPSAVRVRRWHNCARSLKSSLSLKIPAPPTSVQLHGAPQETSRWLRCYPNTKRLLL